MNKWETKPLNEFVRFKRGYDLPTHKFEDGRFPVFGSTSILGYHKTFKVKSPGVITGRSGTLGKFQFSKKDFWPHNTTLWVEDFKGNDPKFSYYLMQCLDFSELNAGGAVPTLNRNVLGSFKIKVPDLNIQKQIGIYLFKYDELIENYKKQILILEEYAKNIFEEWFLRLKINKKKLKINKLTNLPDNWKKIQIIDYVDIISKGAQLNYDLNGFDGIEVLNQSCIRNGEIELDKVLYARILEENKNYCYLRLNDILINSMGQGTLGRVSRNLTIDNKMIIHNCITFLRSKKKFSQYLLFYFLSAHKDYFETIAHGSTGQTTLKEDDVKKLSITVPDKVLLDKFDKKIKIIWEKIGLLKKKINLLNEEKNILMPRLTTGFISIKKLEKLIYE